MSQKILKKEDVESRLDLNDELGAPNRVSVSAPRSKVLSPTDLKESKQASAIIQAAQEEASRIKDKARDIMARVEGEAKKAMEQGYKDGRDEGLASVTEMLATAQHQKEITLKNFEKDIIRLVYDIAEKIIGRDLEEREGAVVDLISQALQVATGQNIIILVNPSDLDAVKKNHAHLMQVLDASRSIQLRGSEKVAPHGCLIETEIGTIDAQLSTQLDAIKKALGIHEEASE